jgi:hypothetical protein
MKDAKLEDFLKEFERIAKRPAKLASRALEEAGLGAEVRVTCVANDVPAEDLLRLALDPLGLVATPDGMGFVIKPKSAKP